VYVWVGGLEGGGTVQACDRVVVAAATADLPRSLPVRSRRWGWGLWLLCGGGGMLEWGRGH